MTTNIGVARAWAFNEGEGSRHTSNGNMHYAGTVLYSYATPIANLVRGRNGHMVALITSEAYSVTTEGKHKAAAHRATNYKGFVVPCLLLPGHAGYGRSSANRLALAYDAAEQHRANLEHYAARIADEAARITRARVYKSRDGLERLQRERDAYAEAFGLFRVAE